MIPKLSVILPSYNPGFSLYLAIKSILNQTFTDFELIILDDGSSDNSIVIAQSFNDPRIRIYCDGINKGLSYRLNQGVSLSRADFIARMDADDLCFPNRFEVQFNYLIAHSDVDLVCCKVVTFNDSNYSLIKFLPYKKYHDQIVFTPWKTIPMPHPTWMGKTSWFKKYQYKTPEIVRAEDQDLLLRSMDNSKFHTLPEVLLAYRQSKFDFRKTLTARVSLLKAQIFNFNLKKQYCFLLYSLLFFVLKIFIDCFALLPKFSCLFFNKMSSKISDNDRTEFEHLVKILSKKIAIE